MILSAIRKFLTGIDTVELNHRLVNIENGGSYAREVAHGVLAEVVHARGGRDSLLEALASKATAGDVAQLHSRVDAAEEAINDLIKPPVSPLEAPGITLINGRQIDGTGKLVEDLPAVKTGERNLANIGYMSDTPGIWTMFGLPVTDPAAIEWANQNRDSIYAGAFTREELEARTGITLEAAQMSKIAKPKARKPRAPKNPGGGK